MAHALSLTTTAEPETAATHSLFKADRPRAIDRHIAFFGEEAAVSRDMCGEALLDALTADEADGDENAP